MRHSPQAAGAAPAAAHSSEGNAASFLCLTSRNNRKQDKCVQQRKRRQRAAAAAAAAHLAQGLAVDLLRHALVVERAPAHAHASGGGQSSPQGPAASPHTHDALQAACSSRLHADAHSLASSSISSFFWHPVEGKAMFSCGSVEHAGRAGGVWRAPGGSPLPWCCTDGLEGAPGAGRRHGPCSPRTFMVPGYPRPQPQRTQARKGPLLARSWLLELNSTKSQDATSATCPNVRARNQNDDSRNSKQACTMGYSLGDV